MSRSPSTFRQRDVTAAVKAVIAAGYDVARVDVDKDGKIVVHTGKPKLEQDSRAGENEWDDQT